MVMLVRHVITQSRRFVTKLFAESDRESFSLPGAYTYPYRAFLLLNPCFYTGLKVKECVIQHAVDTSRPQTVLVSSPLWQHSKFAT